MTRVFAGHLDRNVRIVDQIPLHDHARAAVAVIAVGSQRALVNRVGAGGNVVNRVLKYPPIPGLIVAYVRGDSFKPDVVEPDVVIVVHQILGLDEVLHIAIE